MAIGFKKISIQIGSDDFVKKIPSGFRSLSLNQSIAQHHYLKLVFRWDSIEDGAELLKNSVKYLGKKLELTIVTEESEVTQKEESLKFIGIVSGINSTRSNNFSGDSIIILATSPEIIMDDGSHAKSFSEKNLDDIANEVLGEYSDLVCETSVKSNTKTGTHSFIVQYNETSYRFLNRLAGKYGQWFYFNGSKLIFGEREKSKPIDLKYGKNIYNFNLKLDVQPYAFSFVAYDYKDDQEQKYESDDSSQDISLSKIGEEVAGFSEELFNHKSKILYNHGLSTGKQQDHLDHRVFLKKAGKGSGMVVCSGQTDCPLLMVGGEIKISEKNADHGSYIVVDLNHSVDRNGEYSNSFTAIPVECEIPFTANPHSIPLCETQSAVVVENEDPDNMGRIRVKFFWQEDDEMTPWLRIVSPYAGKEKGLLFVPEIDEEVIVGFEGGNAEKPFVFGALYHAKAYPESWKPDNNDVKAIRTRSGHTIEFRDTDGEEEIWIYDYNKENYFIKFKSHAQEITIEAIEHIQLKAKNISIIAEKDLKIEATDATTKASGNISTEASGNITQEASGNISSEASGNMKIKGGANTTIEAGVQLEEKAAIVKIN
ncbi:MAG: type VI secretion system tip protein VgrG [Mariniphaga sp.]|nr:type VI secretion system tip protein VgrG [Mariniphaga sp.]